MSSNAGSPEAGVGQSRTGIYIYGIVPGDVELVPDTHGIGDPPAEVTLVRHGELAAMVSEVDVDRPIGRPDELKRHEQLLDATTAADVPVLPMRFGAVVASREAVTEQLLSPYHDLFADALRELEGRAEYLVHGRYVEEAILSEVVAQNSQAAALRQRLHDMPADDSVAQEVRLELGETVNTAVDARRNSDAAELIDRVGQAALDHAVRPPSSEWDAVHVAFLVELTKDKEFEEAVERFAADRAGVVKVRLNGPIAPYDFVGTLRPDGG